MAGWCVGRIAVIFLFTTCVWAAEVTTARSGNWGDAATWKGGTVPGVGDTVSIADGHTVTVTDLRSVGLSGPAGSVAVQLHATGSIVVAAGGTLNLRGDVRFTALENAPDAVTVEAGGTWQFDSTAGAKVAYTFGPDANYTFRRFVVKGTPKAYATVRSRPGGPNGRFSLNYHAQGGGFTADYANFVQIGDAVTAGWQVAYEYSGVHAVKWQVTNSNFISCGPIEGGNAEGVDEGGTFQHSHNVHRSSVGGEIFSRWITLKPLGKGFREIKGNVFDTAMSKTGFYPLGATVTGNYFAQSVVTRSTGAATDKWARWSGNLIRFTDAEAEPWAPMLVLGDLLNSYIFLDTNWGNPKPVLANRAVAANLDGVIFGQAGTAYGPPVNADSGELWWSTNPPVPTAYGVYNSIILPNIIGHGSMEIGSVTPGVSNTRAIAEHNIWFGGWGQGREAQPPFPAVMMGENGNGPAGLILSFRSNILWNPQLKGYEANFFKLYDIGRDKAPTLDYCHPSKCDYNTGFGHRTVSPNTPQYTNQGKGYAARFSSMPGVHDVDVDPQFYDWRRNLELFDSKYLGNKPAAWSAAGTYKPGDFVQSQDPTVYWAEPVNFRYLGNPGCRNPKPGVGAGWRNCWEWASLYRIRQAVGAQQLFDDPKIGAKRDDVIMTLMKWVRAGYVPGNPALRGAAHDGLDIGVAQGCRTGPGVACAPMLKTTVTGQANIQK